MTLTIKLTPEQTAALFLLERAATLDVKHKPGDLNDYGRAIILSNILTLGDAIHNLKDDERHILGIEA